MVIDSLFQKRPMVIDCLFQKRESKFTDLPADVPHSLPSQNETANSSPDLKLFQFQVKVTFWFWQMYRPPPNNEIGLNMNAIGKNHFK